MTHTSKCSVYFIKKKIEQIIQYYKMNMCVDLLGIFLFVFITIFSFFFKLVTCISLWYVRNLLGQNTTDKYDFLLFDIT